MSASKVEYQVDQFAKLFSDKDVLKLPANQKIKISQIDPRLCLLNVINSEKNNKDTQYLKLIFDDIFLPMGKVFAEIETSGILNSFCKFSPEKCSISLLSDKEITLRVKTSALITTISRLFRRMQLSDAHELILNKGQPLVFKDIPEEDLSCLKSSMKTDTISSYLLCYMPSGVETFKISCDNFALDFPKELPNSFAISSPNSSLKFKLVMKPNSSINKRRTLEDLMKDLLNLRR